MRQRKRILCSIVLCICICNSGTVHAGNTALLVNKQHGLAPSWEPDSLSQPAVRQIRPEQPESTSLQPAAAVALQQLFQAARRAGLPLVLTSGYRSFDDQEKVYNSAERQDNMQHHVAPAGFSEHQTGLAADIATKTLFCAAQACFALTREAAWLSEYSYVYGFVVRYPQGATAITGYDYEPWHLRYVGIAVARQLTQEHMVLEQYHQR